jgi:hypothetical protein
MRGAAQWVASAMSDGFSIFRVGQLIRRLEICGVCFYAWKGKISPLFVISP